MKLITYILCITCTLLSGCSIRCHEYEIYKHNVIAKGDVSTSINQDHSLLEIGEFATIKIDGSASPSESRSGLVSFEVRVEDKHFFQFKSDKIGLLKDSATPRLLPMGKVKYEIFSSIKPDGTKVPDSSTNSPTNSEIEHSTYGSNGYAQTDYYSFDSASKFQGSFSTFAPAFELAISKNARRRPYLISFEIPKDVGDNFTLVFPNVLIDEKEFQLPTIKFDYVKKSICSDYH